MPHRFTRARWIGRALTAGTACLLALASAAPCQAQQEPSSLKTLLALEEVLSDVIARSEKSVVAIARIKKRDPGDPSNFQIPDLFNRARGLGGNEPLDADAIPNADFIPTEFGTGVVIDGRGLILTNYHVVSTDSHHYVTTSQRKTYRARIKAADLRSDLAVLEIEAPSNSLSLKPIRFGNADNLRKGQIVIALGNPYGIARDGQASAAWGIVSNLSRKAGPTPEESSAGNNNKPTLHHYGTLIQTDAKLNFGTSGGALVNLKGEMVGLTTSLAATAGYEQAAGYAIPIDATFLRIVETLKQGREVEYGFLGVQPSNLDPREVLDGKQGTRVEVVVAGMPAEKAGLRLDDVITEVNGEPIYDADGLVLEVSTQPVESQARFTVLRNGRVIQIKADLAKSPPQGKRIVTTPAEKWRGMRVEYISSLARDLQRDGILMRESCVAVTDVDEGSPAWQAGIRPEMMISHVGSTPVESPKEFWSAVKGKTGAVSLRQVRGSGFGEQERPQYTVKPPSE